MKSNNLFLLITLLMAVQSVSADSDIAGDLNHDGRLSGEEQFLLENPAPTANVTQEEIHDAVQEVRQIQEIEKQESELAAAETIRGVARDKEERKKKLLKELSKNRPIICNTFGPQTICR